MTAAGNSESRFKRQEAAGQRRHAQIMHELGDYGAEEDAGERARRLVADAVRIERRTL
ncbi:hypothetical protein [Spirillospora sp. CA-128828]|uniref:hypothetical protein n=1 Tax=Spirillospora sp. CA-128828 TaxID=3240033 RepID=UPI003D8E3BDC